MFEWGTVGWCAAVSCHYVFRLESQSELSSLNLQIFKPPILHPYQDQMLGKNSLRMGRSLLGMTVGA